MRDLDTTLAKLRERRMAAANSVIAPGVASMAAPVFSHTESLAAVISVVGVRGKLDLSAKSEPARALNEACLELSMMLGSKSSIPRRIFTALDLGASISRSAVLDGRPFHFPA